jgi:hypothetical protein
LKAKMKASLLMNLLCYKVHLKNESGPQVSSTCITQEKHKGKNAKVV